MEKRETSFVDFRKLFKLYLRYWYLFVISVICCTALGWCATRYFKQKAGIRANVLIREEEKSPLASMGAVRDLFGASNGVDDEIFVIESHSLYRDVVKDLGINKRYFVRHGFLKTDEVFQTYPIDVVFDSAIADTLSFPVFFDVSINEEGLAKIKVRGYKNKVVGKAKNVKLPYTFKLPYGDFTVERAQHYPIGEEIRTKIFVKGYDEAAEWLAEEVSTKIPSKKSNVISLAVNMTNGALGKAILSKIIDNYNKRGIELETIERKKTDKFLNDRLNEIGAEVSLAESEIQNFKENKGIIDVGVEAAYQQGKRGTVESELVRAQTSLEIIEIVRDFVNNPDNQYEIIPQISDSGALNNLIGRYNAKLIERNNMLKLVSPENKGVSNLNATLESLLAGIRTSANQTYNNAQKVVNDLKSRLSSTKSQLGGIPQAERTYVDMERERSLKNGIYYFLLNRREENALIIANATPKAEIIDIPYSLTKPIGVTAKVIYFIFIFIGLCLPPVFLYIRSFIRNKIESRDDIESRVDAPIVGEMCIDKTGDKLAVSPNGTTSVNELFRLMRTTMLFMLNDKADKVVLITSTKSGEGKSFISINLAATLSMLGKKVLLIGMDIRNPKLENYLGVRPKYGLTQYLSSESVSISDIIDHGPFNQFPTFDIIVSGPIPPNPAELLASTKVEELFEQLRQQYDYIIVDTAPVGMVSDTFTLNRIADSTIYVTRINSTSNTDIKFINDIYDNKRLNKLGIVINGVKDKKTYGYSKKGE